MKEAPESPASQMDQGHDGNHGEGGWERGNSGENARKIFAKSHGGQSHGSGKADDGRNPSGEKPDRRMINGGKVVIFAAGSGEGGGQFAVGQSPTKGAKAADQPEAENGKTGRESADLKSQAGEHPGANHVCHDQGGCGQQCDRA